MFAFSHLALKLIYNLGHNLTAVYIPNRGKWTYEIALKKNREITLQVFYITCWKTTQFLPVRYTDWHRMTQNSLICSLIYKVFLSVTISYTLLGNVMAAMHRKILSQSFVSPILLVASLNTGHWIPCALSFIPQVNKGKLAFLKCLLSQAPC